MNSKVIVTVKLITGDCEIKQYEQLVYEEQQQSLKAQAHYVAIASILDDESFGEMVDAIHEELLLEEEQSKYARASSK